MKNRLHSFIFTLSLIALSLNAQAYVITTNSVGQNLSWSGGSASPTFYANWTNSSGLSYSDIFTTFTNALSRWKNIGSANISFDYWQGANAGTPTYYAYDGRNSIFFSSESTQKLGSSTLAVTYVYSSNGNILETDIEFNDDSFTFTTNPSDTSRFGNGLTVFLENVATHEIGHAYGLAHSASLQSSMVYLEYREQYKPGCDDIHGLAALYPLSSFTSGRGSITGNIKYSGSTNVFGAHVQAVSKTRGTVVSSTVSASNGSYTLSNLEPGDYYLFVEPFQNTAYLSSLCGGSASGCSFGSINAPTVCSGSPFKRGFIETGTTGEIQSVSVTSGGINTINNYNVSCATLTGAAVSTSIAAADLTTAYLSNTTSATKTYNFVMGATNTSQYFKLSNVSGDISAKVIAYGIYSPFDPVVSIVDSSNTSVAGSTSVDNVFFNTSTLYKNYDSVATLSSATTGDYYIKVTNNGTLAKSKYPAGNASSSQVDATRYYMLIVTIGEVRSLLPDNTNPTLVDNARCENQSDSFTAFTDHGSPPDVAPALASSSSSTSSSSGEGLTAKSLVGGCGMITNISKNHDDFQGPSSNALFSAWGLLFMMMIYRLISQNSSRFLASIRFRR